MTEILGIPALRAEILRYLSVNPHGATTGAIATEFGIPYPTVRRNLEQLEKLGAVVADAPMPRGGKQVVFQLVPETLLTALEENARYVQGK